MKGSFDPQRDLYPQIKNYHFKGTYFTMIALNVLMFFGFPFETLQIKTIIKPTPIPKGNITCHKRWPFVLINKWFRND